ncbi:MAG: phosphotransferase system HPr (HPr) family protein [Planctomycetota bacterium]|jgi:phosphotransferase system HPr (HPr) family protein
MNSESQEQPEASTVSETFCSEEEFSLLLAEKIRVLIHLDELATQNQKAQLSRRVHALVSEQAALVELLLEDHDARYNKTFAGLLELISSLVAFGEIGQGLKIVALHMRADGFLGESTVDDAFRAETAQTQLFADRSVRALLTAIHSEARSCCDPNKSDVSPPQLLSPDMARKRLPHTLGADDHEDVGAMIATEASLFLAANKTMNDRAPRQKFDDVAAMKVFVSRVCNEEQARFLEAKLQNIQSRYDTFIANTQIELNSQTLRDFRHALSMSLQLTRILKSLVHFYERHEDDLRTEASKARVSELIDKALVLDRILNYGLYFIYRYMGAGVPAAENLLSEFTTTLVVELDLPEGVVLHARPASLIAKIVTHHNMPVTITIDEDSCYAGSIMQVILLAGRHLEARKVIFDGDHVPVKHLQLLFENRLGEEGLDQLPDELDYLRP